MVLGCDHWDFEPGTRGGEFFIEQTEEQFTSTFTCFDLIVGLFFVTNDEGGQVYDFLRDVCVVIEWYDHWNVVANSVAHFLEDVAF